jgi:predicted nucleic acid-binding protein
MKVLLDTNVILDVVQNRQPFVDDAAQIMELGRTGRIECAFTANAVSDIFYLISKNLSKRESKTVIANLINIFDVVSIAQDDCVAALALPNEDFEDALVEVCAKKIGADFVVSRDDAFVAAATEAVVIKPDEFLAKLI